MMMDSEEIRRRVTESRARQGLPPTITDPVVLASIARLLRMPRHEEEKMGNNGSRYSYITDEIDRLGGKWTFDGALALSSIDVKRGLANQNRIEALDYEKVSQYEVAMSGGDIFPPIIVWDEPKRSKFQVLDGNHRLAAAERVALHALPAIIVTDDVPEEIAKAVSFRFNAIHGLPYTKEERFVHAADAVKRGMSSKEAAGRFGLSPYQLRDHMAATEVRARARDLKLPAQLLKDISDNALAPYNTITNNEVFDYTLRNASHLTKTQQQQVLRGVKAAPSVEEAKAIVNQAIGERITVEPKPGTKRRPMKLTIILNSLKTILSYDRDAMLSRYTVDPDDLDEIENLLLWMVDNADAALRRIKDMV